MKRQILFSVLAGCALLLGACGQSSNRSASADGNEADGGRAPLVSSRVSNVNPAIGDRIEIEISMDDFPATEGGGISISFNPKVIRVDRVEIDPAWDFATRSGVIDNQSGSIADILFTSFSSPQGSVRGATINASVVGIGKNPIGIVESQTNPFASAGQRFPIDFEVNTFEVN